MTEDEELRMEVYPGAVDLLEEMGYLSELRPAYSGRGMHGQTVPAIVTDAPATVVGHAVTVAALRLTADLFQLGSLQADVLLSAVTCLPHRRDDMGLQHVYY